MTNFVEVNYSQTGKSKNTNNYGMREMQEKAFQARDAQYLLLKAPPASGKSRALMFIALDKLVDQGIKKAIVAVPERAIGGSFKPTELKKFGFFADWKPQDKYNLCSTESDTSTSKVQIFKDFIEEDFSSNPQEAILICTHSTLRFALDGMEETKLDNTLLAIDEFHHLSANTESNRIGELVKAVMQKSTAHIIAMTGSYFRGDAVPVLSPEDESKFEKVTYTYYEQLNGYEYLKSLGIGYHFYQGKYLSAIEEVLDTDKKTIIHIPNVNSGESTKAKHDEVGHILDLIGTIEKQDIDTESGLFHIKRHTDGKIIKVADLVEDDERKRNKVVNYLRNIENEDDLDVIIALGMAKEGFDWAFCEHALTVGYRGSLTEIIQIIGRCTRDSENKVHAQFTNLIAQPEAIQDEVKVSVNNMLKAITASLLMEQVLAPNWNFKTKKSDNDQAKPDEVKIKGFKEPKSQKVKDIIEADLNDLKASILQDPKMLKAMPGNVDPEIMNTVLIPQIIATKYPDLTEEEITEITHHVICDSVFKKANYKEAGDARFIRLAGSFINIDELHIDLIYQINPFQEAFEILSKSVTSTTLRLIQEAIEGTRIEMTIEEAEKLWYKVKDFIQRNKHEPDIRSNDPIERRLAECIVFLKAEKRKRENQNG